MGMLLTPREDSGREARREKGYDSGNVTGTEALIVEGAFALSMAFLDAGL